MRWYELTLCYVFMAAAGVPSGLAAEYEIDQQDKTFMMNNAKVERFSIKVGDTINFKNLDPWFHNVFSLSDISTFDLGSYPQGQHKSVMFSKAGEAEVECAIHPQMYMILEVKP
ncbi:MAG: mauL [Gammaproteobacteria bacterium]|nr:MAG: mauL [Gammaproteobacteria bacterium]TND05814.1 MAG: mauL [Gammaproteobacteria bacterium]